MSERDENIVWHPHAIARADREALHRHQGAVLWFTGLSGSGKSTLVNLLLRLYNLDGGRILIDGQDISQVSQQSLRAQIGMITQDTALLHRSIRDNLLYGRPDATEEELEHAIKRAHADQFIPFLTDDQGRTGLDAHVGERGVKLSGGQRQRIAIARGLMLNPDVVIADEPVSALDVSVRAQVLNLMMDLQQELGLSYVFISHDLSVVEHIADEVMVMYLGRCVEKGTKEAIFNNPRHPYTQALLSATPRLNPDQRRERIKLTGELPSPLNPPPGCAFNARCRRAFHICPQQQPQLKQYGDQLVACFAVDQDEQEKAKQAAPAHG